MPKLIAPRFFTILRGRKPTRLDLPETLTFKEWCEIGEELALEAVQVGWWIGDWWAFGENHYGVRKATVKAPEWKGLGYQACKDAGWVCGQFERSRRRDLLTFTHHREVASLSGSVADRFLRNAEKNKWSVRDLRAEVFQYKSQANRKPIEDGCTIGDLDALIASGQRFSVIYCDPPWTFEVFGALGKDRSAEKHYDTMTLDDIKALPFGQLAAEDCALLMWAIWPEIPGALDVIRAWGFEYKTAGLLWAKHNPSGEGWFTGLGYWTRANTEPCLLATRGKPERIARDVSQLIVSSVSDHSAKPAETYDRIERLLSGPYIELFARERRPGWWAWGNEISREQMAAE